MVLDRLSPRTKAALAVSLALLLWIPQGISSQDQTLVTGHSTFYNGESFDPCLASVAGIVRSRVMWFNDQVLVERYPGKGTYIYITESGGFDPTLQPILYSEGVSYNFVDPNGAAWHVEELFLDFGNDAKAHQHVDANEAVHTPGPSELTTPGYTPGPNAMVDVSNTSAGVEVQHRRQYVWVVELSSQPIYDQFPGSDPHTYYNFLNLVDTCKFHNNTATWRGMENHSTNLNAASGHPAGTRPHAHETWNADIYLGREPVIVQDGAEPYGLEYDTTWAVGGGPQQTSSAAQDDVSWTANDAAYNETEEVR